MTATTPLPKLESIPPSVVAVADYEPLARERMTESAWAYIAGGVEDEWGLAENTAAFRRILLRTRVLRDLSAGHTRVDLFGHTYGFPILLAPVAFQKLVHPEGEAATALAASALGAGMVVSTQASLPLEDIAAAADAPLWFQLYIQPDRDFTHTLVKRAEAAGYRALVVTVDAPVNGIRNREARAGFRLPPDVEAVNLRGMRSPPSTAASSAAAQGRMLLGGPLLTGAPRWRDLAWLRSLTNLPVLAKGIMTAEDARRAVQEGVDGIIVSNHGGRVLDMQPATISVLPEIADAVGADVPILLDGGIRRGSDIFKALALGARAVLVGRPYVYGLATAGTIGVAHVIQILRAELEATMALTGCAALDEIDVHAIRRLSPL